MSLSTVGVWAVGVWGTTVWADGVWYESGGTPPTPSPSKPSGGGRIIGYLPERPKPKKRKVEVKWTDDLDSELRKRLKAIDDDYEKKRRQQLEELTQILRSAVFLGNQVSISGFDYLSPEDVKKAKRKVQIEEENAIILALLLPDEE